MKKLWKQIVISVALMACGVMPAVAQRVGARMGRSGRQSHGRAIRQRPQASRIDVMADETGVVFIADMEDQDAGRGRGRSGRRRPAGLAQRVAWQDEIASDQSVAGIPVLEQLEQLEQQEGTCDSCGSSGCDGSACGGGSCGSCNRWAHGTGVFGEYLYLRARDSEVTYASPVDGATVPIPGPGNQMAPVGIVDPDYSSGARIGFNWAWDEMTSIRGTYTRFESDTTNAITAEPGNFVLADVTHPGVNNAGNNWLDGAASLDIDFQLADVEYRWLFSYGDLHAVNLFAGVRYGELVQDFRADFSVNGTRTVDTRVRFEGGGLRVGFDAERYAACTGWLVYGRGAASFVAGEFRGSYYQNSSFANPEIDTAWKAGRVVTILDLELGLGWKSRSGRLQLGAGYLFSAWLNTVQTDTFIGAVQANRFADLGGETTTFDGFTARAEYRF